MKNNQTVADIRCGYIFQRPPEESLRFAVSGREYFQHEPCNRDWTPRPLMDQGATSACTGFGTCHTLLAEPYYLDPAKVNKQFAMDIYYEAQRLDPWPGGEYPGASPKYKGSSVYAVLIGLQKLGIIDTIEPAPTFSELISGLSFVGPAIVGTKWYSNMTWTGKNGLMRATGRVMGGHCYSIRAQHLDREIFTIQNSHGPRWGDKGQGILPFTDMQKLMQEQSEVYFVTLSDLGKSWQVFE